MYNILLAQNSDVYQTLMYENIVILKFNKDAKTIFLAR